VKMKKGYAKAAVMSDVSLLYTTRGY